MSDTQRISPWLADITQPTFPVLAADISADIVVVGGGIAGLTTALLAQRDGARVVVLEAERIGAGSTGNSTGKVTSQHGLFASQLIKRHGQKIAEGYVRANQTAVEQVARLVDELQIDCAMSRADAYVYTTDAQRLTEFGQETADATQLGLRAEVTRMTPLPFEVQAAVRVLNQVQLNPAAYAVGLAQAITDGGGQVFEFSRVVNVSDNGGVHVTTDSGSVKADKAVIATLIPIVDIGAYFAKQTPSRAYGIAVTLNQPPPQGMFINADKPVRSLRPWSAKLNGMVVVGDDHAVGEGDDMAHHYRALEHWTRQHFTVEEVHHHFSAQDYRTIDGLPYVGRCARTRNVYVATGFRKWGLSNGTAAATLLADLFAGRSKSIPPYFRATRSPDLAALVTGAHAQIRVATHMVGDRLARLTSEDVAALAPGEGGIVRMDGHVVAAFRDDDGDIHALNPTCTHLGCTVAWNSAELSWDCPCHGSRFDTNGQVLDGPATAPLPSANIPADD